MAPRLSILLMFSVILQMFIDPSMGICRRGGCTFSPRGKLSSKFTKECYGEDDLIEYACDGRLYGPPKNRCKNGQWENPTPICEGFTCGTPPFDKSVKVNSAKTVYKAREVVTFSCVNVESVLMGPKSVSCDRENTWNPGTKPICLSKCTNPVIEHGRVHANVLLTEGDSTKVTCDDGYRIPFGENKYIKCGSHGEWDHIPQCVAA